MPVNFSETTLELYPAARLKMLARTGALLTFLIAAICSGSWALQHGSFQDYVNAIPVLVPNAAGMFILLALSLWLLQKESSFLFLRITGRLCGLIAAAGGALIVFEHLSGRGPGIDHLFFPETLRQWQIPPPGRPSLFTSINFFLMGSALCLAPRARPAILRICEIFALITIQISLLALVGYVCNIPLYYGWRSLFPGMGMTLQTLTAFLFLTLGFLAAIPDCGLTRLLRSRTTGGMTIRRLILAPVLIPLILGGVERFSVEFDLYNYEVSSWLFAFLNVFFFTGIIWWVSRLLFNADLIRLQAERKLQNVNEELERAVEERTRELSLVLREIQESEKRMRLVLDAALDAVITIDAQGVITSWNPEAERIFGWSEAEILGQSLTESIIPPQHREAHQRGMKHFAATREGPVLNRRIEITALRRDGSQFPVELAITPIRIGIHTAFSAFLRDITERKKSETEIQNLNATLEQRVRDRTSQLEAANRELEAFSYSVSHDLRTPLRHIDGYVEMLKEDKESQLTPQSKRFLNTIAKAANRMGKLIDDLLGFSRTGREEMHLEPVATDELVAEVIQELLPENSTRIVHWDIGPLPTVKADRPLLKQVWINLISNALKYSQKRGESRIKIQQKKNASGEWEFSITDNGAGFNQEYAGKLFAVFQRLHLEEEFEGTGIGLANVSRILLRHGGRIWAEGVVDQGATFHFTLPVKNTQPDTTTAG